MNPTKKNNLILLVAILGIAGFSVYYATAGIFKTNRRAVNDLTSGLVGYWTFDGQDTNWGTNTMIDRSGSSNTGTMTNMSTSTSPVAGVVGQALHLDGATKNIYVGDPAGGSLDFNEAFSLALWINPDSVAAFKTMLDKDQDPPGWKLGVSDTNKIRFLTRTAGGADNLYTSASLNVGVWQHIVATRDSSGNKKVYINGFQDSVTTNQSGDISSAQPFRIGHVAGTVPGLYDEVRIYNRALSASEITDLYNQGAKRLVKTNISPTTSLTNGLTGYWTFDGQDTAWTSATAGTTRNRGLSGVATLVNMSQATSPVVGKVGQSMYLDGSNDQIATSYRLSSLVTGASSTISAWIRPTDDSKSSANPYSLPPIITDYDAVMGISIGTVTGQGKKIWVWNYDGNTDQIGIDYNLNEWIHVVLVHSGGNLYVYKNGVQSGSVASGTTNDSLLVYFVFMGYNQLSNQYFKGSIDEVRTYNRGLSASEVAELYNMGEKMVVKTSMPQADRFTSGLVGYWTLDGQDTNWGTNTTTDRSTSGYTGMMTNMATSTDAVPGVVGQAMNFNGSSSRVNLGATPNMNFTRANSFSVSAWVKRRDTATGNQTIINNWNSVLGSGWVLRFSNNKIAFTLKDQNDNARTGATSGDYTSTSDWYHITATYNGTASGFNIYVNGQSVGIITADATIGDPSYSTAMIGARINPDSYFNGLIDEVRVYSRVLSASEALEMYQAGAGR